MESILHSRSEHVTPDRLQALLAMLSQLSRYSAASALALVLDFTVYLVLTTGDMKPVFAGVLGYGAGLALHFLLSSKFVFGATPANKAQTRLFGEFALSGLAGIARDVCLCRSPFHPRRLAGGALRGNRRARLKRQ